MARRKKSLLVAERSEKADRFTRAKNLFAKVVTNHAAGLDLSKVINHIFKESRIIKRFSWDARWARWETGGLLGGR